jgi:DNA-binding transcriptional LysR family regulator
MDDLRLLRVLREVALRGSFSAAADALSYSQPAVSQQIARLEAQTGVKLIERQPKGVKLTPAGEALVRRTESILSELAHAQAELTEIASSARGRLRLAAFTTAAGTIVPRAVKEFRRMRPGVQVDLQLMDPPQSIPALRRGEVDLVITEEGGFEADPDLAGLGVERLMDDVLYASLPADHPLATRRAVALTDLCDEEWMLVGLRGTCADSNIVLRACQQAGFEPRVAYTSDDYFAIQGLVASGMGVALVPGLALISTREDVAVRPLRGRPPYRRIGAVFPADPVGPVAVMVDCLRDAAEEYKRLAPVSAVATAA